MIFSYFLFNGIEKFNVKTLFAEKNKVMELKELLKSLAEQKGSDLHLKVGARPIIRKNGKLSILSQDFPTLDYKIMHELIGPLIDEKSQEKLHKHGSVDIGYGLTDIGRFRFNVAFQRGSIRVVVRRIPCEIPTPEELNLPKKISGNCGQCSKRFNPYIR